MLTTRKSNFFPRSSRTKSTLLFCFSPWQRSVIRSFYIFSSLKNYTLLSTIISLILLRSGFSFTSMNVATSYMFFFPKLVWHLVGQVCFFPMPSILYTLTILTSRFSKAFRISSRSDDLDCNATYYDSRSGISKGGTPPELVRLWGLYQ